MSDDRPLDDPDTAAALRLILSRSSDRATCPRCGHRDQADGSDWCGPCGKERAEEDKAKRRRWWNRQGDYEEQRRRVGAQEGAVLWLVHRLRKGPVDSREVWRDAHADGIADRTLRKARAQLREQGRLDITRYSSGRTSWSLAAPQAPTGPKGPGAPPSGVDGSRRPRP